MTKTRSLTAIAVLALALPTVVLAQNQAPPAQDPAAAPAPQDMSASPQSAPAASQAGMNTSTGPIPADQLPPGQASALSMGDNRMVTNGPVPDTAANRAKYGGPMSNGGRHTKPVGN